MTCTTALSAAVCILRKQIRLIFRVQTVTMKLKVFFRLILSLPRKAVSAPIKFYRKHLSPLKGTPSCRFTPTCSEYALEAISEWGVIIGLTLGAYRILRCNPLCRCGEDDIPHVRRKIIPKTNVLKRKCVLKNKNRYKIFYYTNVLD